LPLVAGGLDKKPAFKPFTPMGGAVQVHDLAAWHVMNDVQKINVFADESIGISVNFCDREDFYFGIRGD
jgi:hypothetical protein